MLYRVLRQFVIHSLFIPKHDSRLNAGIWKGVSTSTVIVTPLLTPSLQHDCLPKKNKEQVEFKITGLEPGLIKV